MSATEYFDSSGSPATASSLASATMRAEFDLIQTGFGKLPDLAGNGNKAVVINAGGTAMTVTAATLALAVAFTTAGSGGITLTSTGATNVTLPTTGTLATLAGAESLSSKTLPSPVLSGTVTGTYALGGTPTINVVTAVGGAWTAAATWTLPAFTLGGLVTSNGQSFSGTIADLGIVTTADINGGTIDGVTIGGAAAGAGTFTTGSFSSTLTLTGAAANIALGSNFISNGGTDAGFSLDASNNATFSGNLTVSGASATISAGFLSSVNAAASQIRASGWGQVQGASPAAGQIDIGGTVANQGRLQYSSGGSTALYIDNSFDDTGAAVIVRTRSAGTPVTAATFTNGNTTLAGNLAVAGAAISASSGIVTPVGTTALSSLRVPHGAAPTSPVDGDVWSTTTTLNFRLNGVTKTVAFV